jgi:hypothetical protein
MEIKSYENNWKNVINIVLYLDHLENLGFPRRLISKKKQTYNKRKGHIAKQKRNNKMKRKGMHTLEVIMWVWVCYNREVLLLSTSPLLLFSKRKH